MYNLSDTKTYFIDTLEYFVHTIEIHYIYIRSFLFEILFTTTYLRKKPTRITIHTLCTYGKLFN